MERTRKSWLMKSMAGLACSLLAWSQAGAITANDMQARVFKVNAKQSIPYRLFVPKNYDKSKKYPIMLSLHGAGERGTDNVVQVHWEFTNFWGNDSIQKDNPCFLLVPQCPPDPASWVTVPPYGDYNSRTLPITWDLQAVMDILDSLGREFSLDSNRTYVSGMSMGGIGTWYLLAKFPQRFAAAVPVCGGGDTARVVAQQLAQIPIWAFHAADDPTISVQYSRDMVAAIRAVDGSNLKYTEYPASMKLGHESWVAVGKDPAVHRWVFQQVRKAPVGLVMRSQNKLTHGEGWEWNGGLPALRIDALGRVQYVPDSRKAIPSPAWKLP